MGDFAQVAVDIAVANADRLFTYRVPEGLRGQLAVGQRVRVPFGRRRVEGFVLGFLAEPGVDQVKEIEALVDATPQFSQELVELARWIAGRTHCVLVQTLRCLLPPGARRERVRPLVRRLVRLRAAAPSAGPDGEPFAGRHAEVAAMAEVAATMEAEAEVATGAEIALSPRQQAVVAWLRRQPGLYSRAELARSTGVSAGVIEALLEKGVLEEVTTEVRRDPYGGRAVRRDAAPLSPTPEQARAIAAIGEAVGGDRHQVFLLHGVTGSGKTEVYLRGIESALARGRQALVLVPEIALTPQLMQTFRGRFGEQVAVLHSGLSAGERFDEWRRIRDGRVQVAVGARSAVFAPFDRLGLVILDEEHETTYKQDEIPRYHAREVAIERARLAGAAVVLGSATPAVESYHAAAAGRYTLLEIPRRIDDRPLPSVAVVDMREELAAGNRRIFSRRLEEAVRERLARREQVILFLNRRGYHTFILCRECGHVLRCPRCDVSLTQHVGTGEGARPSGARGPRDARDLRDRSPLRCHYCQYEAAPPERCPHCGGRHIRYFGAGTQRVEEAARDLFPEARILRMDVDTTGTKGAHERLYHQFRRGEADILIGTQMVAKGLDIGGVTLVGAISADTALHLPDFRGGERTFQLLTQVAGRAGRGDAPGEVIVQTYSPEHYAIEAASRHDYAAFYRQEIETRRQLGYPPFGHLARVVVAHPLAKEAEGLAARLGEGAAAALAAFGGGYELLGPARAPLGRLHGRHRWHLLLKGPDRDALARVMREVAAGAGATGLPGAIGAGAAAGGEAGAAGGRTGGAVDEDALVSVDMDPVQML